MNLRFLTIDDVLRMHNYAIAEYGGSVGIRDINLLESAVAQPEMFVFGEYVHKDIFHMGAAYSFHIIKNHPFVDGNKRTGIIAALTFFDYNSIFLTVDLKSLYNFAIDIADSKLSKEQIAEFYKNFTK
jgi:death on curing protein